LAANLGVRQERVRCEDRLVGPGQSPARDGRDYSADDLFVSNVFGWE
jgi:hypothetical protein